VRLWGVAVKPAGILSALVSGFIMAVGLYYAPNTPGDIAERSLPFLTGLLLFVFREKQ